MDTGPVPSLDNQTVAGDSQPKAGATLDPRFWPIFALFPVIVAGQVKATGIVSIGGVDITVLSVAFLLAATAVTFVQAPRYPLRQMIPYLLFTLVVLVGVARSDPGEYQVRKARDFLVLTGVIVWCVPVLLRDLRDLRGLLLVWFTAGVSMAALVQIVGGAEDLYGRAGIGEATLGPAYLSAAAIAAGGAALGEKLIRAYVAVPGMVIAGVALVTIGSRGPMVAVVLGLLVWTLMRGALRARSLVVWVAVAAVAWIGVRQASEAALSRLTLEDASRQQLWATAREVFFEGPIVGLGWGNFTSVSWIADYPHNLFLETAAELGLIGLVSLFVLLAVMSARIWRCRNVPEVRVLSAVAIVVLAGQQFSGDLSARVFWVALIPCLLLPLPESLIAPNSPIGPSRPMPPRAASNGDRDSQ